ncbi:putative Late nodulin [Medicago truncatula]|uniref:Putative Late nodulin n=1 Tax=Medicago truncatula TaxID=3880 RepID=A0A396GYI1_MEDTR|nr:putative Late nodulin [Medicago truncatula]
MKNMTQIPKCVYLFFIFLSLFHVVTNGALPCAIDVDCPDAVFFIVFKCINNICIRIETF